MQQATGSHTHHTQTSLPTERRSAELAGERAGQAISDNKLAKTEQAGRRAHSVDECHSSDFTKEPVEEHTSITRDLYTSEESAAAASELH